MLDAAFRRVGVLRVNAISQVFDLAEVLAKQPRPRGPRLAIVTNAGGPGVLATDALIENRGELARLSPATLEALDAFLPAAWSHNNPIDILGDADAHAIRPHARRSTIRDPDIDGLLVDPDPPGHDRPDGDRPGARRYAKVPGKPVLASWMGGETVEPGEKILDQAGHPDLRLSRHRRADLHPHVAVVTTTSRPCTRPRSRRPATRRPQPPGSGRGDRLPPRRARGGPS